LNGLAADPVLSPLSFNQTRLLLLLGLYGERAACQAVNDLGHISPATISKCADRLVQLGLAERRRQCTDHDQRIIILLPTKAAIEASHRAERICDRAKNVMVTAGAAVA
jgi:DNA-binding MarR family transcriptional regulator